MVAVQGIAASAEIIVFAVRSEHVIDVVVKSFETEGRTDLIAFGGMIEHYVQDHVDLVVVERFYEFFQLHPFPVVFDPGGVTCIRGEETDRIVPPVIQKVVAVDVPHVPHLVKFKYRHQLDRVDPQLLQIGDLFFQSAEGSGVIDLCGRRLGESAHMEFVDHQVFHGDRFASLQPPVEVVLYHAGAVAVLGIVCAAPAALAGHGPGIGIQQDLGLIEAEPFFLVIGSVQPVGVLEFFHVQAEDDHGIDEADPVIIRKLQRGIGLFRLPVEEEQFAGSGSVGLDREIHAARDRGGAEEPEEPGANRKSGDIVQWF